MVVYGRIRKICHHVIYLRFQDALGEGCPGSVAEISQPIQPARAVGRHSESEGEGSEVVVTETAEKNKLGTEMAGESERLSHHTCTHTLAHIHTMYILHMLTNFLSYTHTHSLSLSYTHTHTHTPHSLTHSHPPPPPPLTHSHSL